jgi:mutator protein MutT
MIIVVAAVIEESGRFLVTLRPDDVHLGGLWEFPGGKAELSESHAAALNREIREELDADVEVHELIFSTTHEYPDRNIGLFFYRCTLIGRPKPLLGQKIRWVPPGELETLEFPPADHELIRVLARSG